MDAKFFLEAMGQLDSAYYEEAAAYCPPRRRRAVKWVLLAACICLLLGSLTALALHGGVQLQSIFTGRDAGDDLIESGYDLALSLEKLPDSAFSRELLALGPTIRQQYLDASPYDSRSPGLWQADFSTPAEAWAFTGLPALPQADWAAECTGSTLWVSGNAQGQLLSLELETDYRQDGLRLQYFVHACTVHNTDEETTLSLRTTENLEFSSSSYQNSRQRSFLLLRAAPMESGYATLDAYIADGGLLHNLHIAYPDGESDQAEALLAQWAELF